MRSLLSSLFLLASLLGHSHAASLPRHSHAASAHVRGPTKNMTSNGPWTDVTGAPSKFTSFTGTFKAPPTPTDMGASVFLWFGVQFSGPGGDGVSGVLQPVLMWGPDCCNSGNGGSPHWYMSSQYVTDTPAKCTCPQNPIEIQPGETISSSIDFTGGAWRVSWSSGGKGDSITVQHPGENPSRSWSDYTPYPVAAVERYSVKSQSQMPSGNWECEGKTDGKPVNWRGGGKGVNINGLGKVDFDLSVIN